MLALQACIARKQYRRTSCHGDKARYSLQSAAYCAQQLKIRSNNDCARWSLQIMLLIILGAGASFDSVAHLSVRTHRGMEERPPLADELFDNRGRFAAAMGYFPQLNGVITNLRFRQKEQSVEQALQHLQSEAIVNPMRYKQLAAIRYYLQTMLWQCESSWEQYHKGINNFSSLLDHVEHWRGQAGEQVWLVTFNYDRLLENALFGVGVRIHQLPDYISDPRYKLLKIHGSVNWARELDGTIPKFSNSAPWTLATELIEFAPKLHLSSRFRVVNSQPPTYPEVLVFPALAIPLENKNEFECPSEHLDAFKSAIPKIDKIITIGWRGNESHFLKLVSKKISEDVRGLAVSGDTKSAEETIGQLESANINGEFDAFNGGFTDLIVSHSISKFLDPH